MRMKFVEELASPTEGFSNLLQQLNRVVPQQTHSPCFAAPQNSPRHGNNQQNRLLYFFVVLPLRLLQFQSFQLQRGDKHSRGPLNSCCHSVVQGTKVSKQVQQALRRIPFPVSLDHRGGNIPVHLRVLLALIPSCPIVPSARQKSSCDHLNCPSGFDGLLVLEQCAPSACAPSEALYSQHVT